jgi:hypothetical protein
MIKESQERIPKKIAAKAFLSGLLLVLIEFAGHLLHITEHVNKKKTSVLINY